MAVAIIGDMHVGARGGNAHVREYIAQWCRYAFEDMSQRGIDTYIQLGDAFDIRRHLLGMDYEWIVNEFIPLHEKYGISGVYIDGNHDLPYKETNKTSWVDLLARLCPAYITRISEPTAHFQFGATASEVGCFLPWICEANLETSLKAIEASTAKYCFAHLELGGFEMYRGNVSEESRFNLNAGHFSKFDAAYTGHFHTKSESGVIKYVGTPYPLTWADYQDAEDDLRGYHILAADGACDFVPNPEHVKSFFKILTYNWAELNLDDKLALQYKSVSELEDTIGLKGKIVKIVIADRGNAKHYKDFVDAVRQCKTIDVTYVDMTVGDVAGVSGLNEGEAVTDEMSDVEVVTDIESILNSRVDKSTIPETERPQVKEIIKETYGRAKGTNLSN